MGAEFPQNSEAVVATEAAAREAGDAAEKAARESADAILAGAVAAKVGTSALVAEEERAKAAEALALPKAGGTMTGAVVLAADPTANLNPATKQWVEGRIAALINGAPGALDTLKEIADRLELDESAEAALIATVAGKLTAASNLSDLTNAVTARTNLGLGSAATQASTAFDTAGAAATEKSRAEGVEASKATTSALSAETSARESADSTLTSAVAAEATRAEAAEALKLAKASNLSDLASAATARTNLGLGTAATHPSTDFDSSGAAAAVTAEVATEKGRAETQEGLKLTKASNLSDVASASSARTNLGLGTAATSAASAFDVAGAAATEETRAKAAEALLAPKTEVTTERERGETAEALKLAKASNLSDLASASTARTNLGLGSAATQASSAFDAAGAATTEETRAKAAEALLATIATADAIARMGLKAKYYWAPSLFAEQSSKTMVASKAFYAKFIPHRAMTLRGVSFVVNEAATANDKCAVAIYNAAKERKGISAETESKLNSTGLKDIDFTGDVTLEVGKTYFLAFQYSTAGGTIAKLMGATIGNVQPIKLFGEEFGEDGSFAAEAAPTFPFATLPAATTISAFPVLLARER